MRLAIAHPSNSEEAKENEGPLISFSRGMANEERALKRFMYARLYHHPKQIGISERASLVVAGLAEAYFADPDLLPDHWRATLPDSEPERTRHIGDFIAGMTDRYALARYREVIGPFDMPDGF